MDVTWYSKRVNQSCGVDKVKLIAFQIDSCCLRVSQRSTLRLTFILIYVNDFSNNLVFIPKLLTDDTFFFPLGDISLSETNLNTDLHTKKALSF